MEALIKTKQNCKLRRIDINTWGSAVAKQYGVQSIPKLWLYDGTKRVSTDARDVMNRVSQLE